ncbi:MAG: hypothetical protein QNK37_20570, partial [Acidobacteriota bacterium]|nr:hypothetical protein [Acidobacteriota bacterium]
HLKNQGERTQRAQSIPYLTQLFLSSVPSVPSLPLFSVFFLGVINPTGRVKASKRLLPWWSAETTGVLSQVRRPIHTADRPGCFSTDLPAGFYLVQALNNPIFGFYNPKQPKGVFNKE